MSAERAVPRPYSAQDDAPSPSFYRAVGSGAEKLVSNKLTAAAYTDTDITAGIKYACRVRVLVDGQWSGYSDAVSATAPAAKSAAPASAAGTAK